MARTKQTAHKRNMGGKPAATFSRQQRKVILQYSSDEAPDQQVPGVEFGQPNRVTKRITLTLPTKLTHVTLTDSFHQFFHQAWPQQGIEEGSTAPWLDPGRYAGGPDELYSKVRNQDPHTKTVY